MLIRKAWIADLFDVYNTFTHSSSDGNPLIYPIGMMYGEAR